MNRKILCAALAPALILPACEPAASPANDSVATTQTAPTAEPAANADASVPARPEAPEAPAAEKPDFTPPALTPEAERGETGARNILLSFARAIELKEFGQAWTLLSPADQRKWSKAQFAGMFADLGKINVAIPTGSMGAAAGSSYYSAPVTITANDKQGRPVRIEGKAVLRRVNDVDGSTVEQRRWHFETLTLDWTH